jgi:LysM repeat protein
MNKKLYALALVFILMGLAVTACTRSATQKQPGAATATSEIPFPVGTLDTSARVTEIVQQTQAALPTPVLPVLPKETQPTAIVIATTAPTQAVLPTATTRVIPTSTRPETYTLKEGEWPICIARRYNLDLFSFLEANGLQMDSTPAAGTVLKISATGTWSAGERSLKSHPTTYTVKSGDTIFSIACQFGDVDPEAIIIANDLQSPYTVQAGQTLQIP